MSRMSRSFVVWTVVTFFSAAVLVLAGAAPRVLASADPPFAGFPCPSNATLTCVMSGLDGVRGLAFAPDSALYAVEAGHGGDGPCTVESGVRVCYGPTGAISRLRDGLQERFATGLPSLAVNDPLFPARRGTAANGPTDISFMRRDDEPDEDEEQGEWRTAYVTIGLRNNPARRADLGEVGAGFATLARLAQDGTWRFIADLGASEAERNPDGGEIDSNPFGVLAQDQGRVVVDAGANALLRVVGRDHVSTIATFPSRAQGRGTDAVPTSVAVGPDDAYYVSELTGVPFATFDAAVYRIVPHQPPQIYRDGFRMIIDIAFDADWNLYVLQYATVPASTPGGVFGRSGALVKVAPDGTRTTVIGGLRTPTSVAVGSDGFLYIGNNGNARSIGEVIRVAAPN